MCDVQGQPVFPVDPGTAFATRVNELTRFVLVDLIPKLMSAILLRCMMGFFQLTSMLFLFFEYSSILPRKHCDVSEAITELHTWKSQSKYGNKVYPVIVYNSVYDMYSRYIYSI